MSVLGPDGPRVLAEKCSTCIFHSGNRMHLKSGRVKEMTEDALNGGGYITCHHTLPFGQYPEAGEAICRGFFDAFGPQSNVIRVWGRLGGFVEVPDPAESVGVS